jgi:hypothetical protein
MNYTLCLDPYSVNFNINSLSGNGFNIYTDADNFAFPIAVNIPASSIFSAPLGNCSVTLTNVPNNATQLLIVDNCNDVPLVEAIIPSIGEGIPYSTECCYALIDIPEGCNSLCDDCSLVFDTFQTSSVGKIVAGNLISSCGTVTDYVIGWYLNGDYSAPAITTGFGTAAGSYQFGPHPLTGNSAVPVLAGNWEGVILDIVINGTLYSNVVSGKQDGIPIPFESCFDTVVIDPLSCDNGAYQGIAKYSHQFNFNSQAVGTTSAPVSLTYALDSSVKYFAYAFEAFNVWDEIEIKWVSGDPNATSNPSLYSQPIYLEKLKKGQGLPQNTPADIPNPNNAPGINPSNYLTTINNVWPKISSEDNWGGLYGEARRVLALTNLETSSNPVAPDFLEITITPNPSNNNTQWKAGFQCLTNFDCTDCTFEDWPNSLPKINQIRLAKQYGCDSQGIALSITGCYQDSDAFANYNDPWQSLTGSLVLSITQNSTTDIYAPPHQFFSLVDIANCGSFRQGNYGCGLSSTGSITLSKTPNQIQLTFNLESDYLHYKNSLLSIHASLGSPGCNQPCLGGCGSSPFNPNYYKYFSVRQPIQGINIDCGDNSTEVEFHFSANDYCNIQYVENAPSNFFSITIPQTAMINCYPNTCDCDSCYGIIQSHVDTYNSNLSSTFSFTTNVGAKFSSPFHGNVLNRSLITPPSGSYCVESNFSENLITLYSTHTIPFISSSTSPTGWVNLPSLGDSLPCDFTPYQGFQYSYADGQWVKGAVYYYQVRFPHLGGNGFDYSLSTNDFEVYSLSNNTNTGSVDATQGVWPVPCSDPSGSLIYSYIGGVATMHSSSYFWQGNAPTLIIDP